MTDYERITPAEVVAAFEKTGLEPARYTYFDETPPGEPDQACALQAVATARRTSLAQMEWGFDNSYWHGFTCGWDNDSTEATYGGDWDTERVTVGLKDGKASWAAVRLAKKGLFR